MKTLRNMDFSGKHVLLRVDYNVPLDEKGDIVDDYRIKNSLPTIKYILKSCKQLIIMSHLGRPEGEVVEELRLDKVAVRLMKMLGKKVAKVNDCVDILLPDEKIVLLENLRFRKGEKENDRIFAKKLASFADVYVNDAFGTCHRKNASMVAVPKLLPGCVGFLVENEIKFLNFDNVQRPFIVVMGGSKLSTKFPVMNKLLPFVDKILLGGAMIFNFYKVQGFEIGDSLFEEEQLVTANLLYNNEKIVLPKDIVISHEKSAESEIKTVKYNKIPKNWIGLDVGKKSIDEFKDILKSAKTVFWNGPLGYFEVEEFGKATYDLAKFLSKLKIKTIIGGGDSVSAIRKLKLDNKFTHISTGGGAALAYIKNKNLPAFKALES